MKIAVLYYSLSGNAAYMAENIAKELDADLIRIEPVKEYPKKGFAMYFRGGGDTTLNRKVKLKSYDFDASKYDTIIIGSPVWASMFSAPIKTFVRENAEGLKGKTIAAFLCQKGSGSDKAFKRMKETLGIQEFKAELMLIEPRAAMNTAENERKIKEFCGKIMKQM